MGKVYGKAYPILDSLFFFFWQTTGVDGGKEGIPGPSRVGRRVLLSV